MQHRPSLPIPDHMVKLGLDRRGFPVPFIVWRDAEGNPHFTVNDHQTVEAVLDKQLCSICGNPLHADAWAIGGPMSAFHERGAYVDPLVHGDCGAYAVRTCPYISYRNWSVERRIDGKTVKPGKNGTFVILMDPTMIPEKPPFFVLAKTGGFTVSRPGPNTRYVLPYRPWLQVQFWKDGEQINGAQAAMLLQETGTDPRTLKYWPA